MAEKGQMSGYPLNKKFLYKKEVTQRIKMSEFKTVFEHQDLQQQLVGQDSEMDETVFRS